jgi:hypothetical protein
VLEKVDTIILDRARLELRRRLLVKVPFGELFEGRRFTRLGPFGRRILSKSDTGEKVASRLPGLIGRDGGSRA